MFYRAYKLRQKLRQQNINRIKILEREKYELSKIGFSGLERKDQQIEQLRNQIIKLQQINKAIVIRMEELQEQNLILQETLVWYRLNYY